MILWMTRDAFSAAMLGFVVIVLFVGYNSARKFRKDAERAKAAKADSPSHWN
jgi:hypothetical protein